MVGTTTSVRDDAGIPLEKSIRGSGCGVASKLASQFTSATAKWLAPSNAGTLISANRHPATPSAAAIPRKAPESNTVNSAIPPR